MKRVIFLLLLVAGAVFAQSNYSQVYSFSFPDIQTGSSDWGDFDNDGDLDLLLTGANGLETKIYRNDGFYSFSYVDAGLVNIAMGEGKWGDFDNDGLLDILVTGDTDPGNFAGTVRVYKNNGDETFTDVTGDIDYILWSSADWGDFDNDGDLDFAVNGGDPVSIVKIYRNNSGIFELAHSMQGGAEGSVEWGDYDNDGDLDLIVTGYRDFMMNEYITKIYRNDGGFFTDIGAGLEQIAYGEAAWGDYDNDGDLDILLSGMMFDWNLMMDTPVTKIYRNDGSGIFTDINAPLMNLQNSSVAWGDCDLDGDLDAVISGSDSLNAAHTIIYANDGGDYFSDTFPDVLQGTNNTDISLANLDGDWDLDLFVGGNGSFSLLYECVPVMEQPRIPTTPENVSLAVSGRIVNMDWTSLSGIDERSFNVHVEVNGNILLPSMSDSTGYRRTVSVGNAGLTPEYNMVLPEPLPLLPQQGSRHIEFKVQAVNNCYTGSGFAAADTLFTSNDLRVDSAPVMLPEDNLYWEYLIPDSIAYYKIEVSTDSAFSQVFQDSVLINSKKAVTNSKGVYFGAALNEFSFIDSFEQNQEYFWRVKPVYSNPFRPAHYTQNDDVLSFIFDPVDPPNQAPNPPVSGFTPAEGVTIEDTTPMLFWDHASDPDNNAEELRYILIVSPYISLFNPVFTDTTAAGITYSQVDTVLESGTEYYYKIKTVDPENLQSAWSVTQNFNTLTLYPPDRPMSGFVPYEGEFISDTTPLISWDPAYDPDDAPNDLKYCIDLYSDSLFTQNVLKDTTALGVTSFQVPFELQRDQKYWYWVYTIDDDGQSSMATLMSFTVKVLYAPIPPVSGFNPANGRLITDSTPVISWDYASDPDGYPGELKYTIELDYESSFTDPFYADSTEAGINYIEISQELDRGVEIYYRIRTADRDGLISDWSEIQYFLVDILYSPDPPVSGFSPANDELTDLQPTINWGNAYDEDGHAEDLKYWIGIGSSKVFNADSTEYHMTDPGETFYNTVSPLLGGTRYYYRIKTFDINSLSSGWSATQQFITLMPPQSVKITIDGLNLTVNWDDIPINTKGVVYTVYGSDDPYSGFVPVAVQLTQSEWTVPITEAKKFYRVTAGSSGK